MNKKYTKLTISGPQVGFKHNQKNINVSCIKAQIEYIE